MSDKIELDFSTVMFSTIHDVKNSLVVAQGSLTDLSDIFKSNTEANQSLALLQYEIERTNHNLVRMLMLYKLNQEFFTPHLDEYEVDDFLDELIIHNEPYGEAKQVVLEKQCSLDEEDTWYLDRDLLASVINSVINNALRYAKSKIIISAEVIDKQLHIHVDDDGGGYPDEFIRNWKTRASSGFNYESQSTGLGLYFAEKVAQAHVLQGVHGDVMLEHSQHLDGARFTMVIP
ncbi:MAG: HAMP domain-containing histidine kinase [Methylococcales bacterium]|jgi:signal transduction histidine kinase|nr:HAMP domain-containing histidine kinase [Methylococcales bacterium]MBT7443555.1 HAMP domain-containing histidine kinase [Methylococcales bacterium]